MLEKISLKAQAYQYLKNAILSGEIKADVIYSESQFASMLNVSRTPVREAVLQLAQENFLTIHPSKGVSVKMASPDEIRNLFEFRLALEGYCCMNLAEKSSTAEGIKCIRLLDSLLRQEEDLYANGGTLREFMEQDTAFHISIATFTNNSNIIENMGNLRLKIEKLGIKIRIAEAIIEHRLIVDSIKAGNSHRAYDLVRKHFDASMEAVLNQDNEKGEK